MSLVASLIEDQYILHLSCYSNNKLVLDVYTNSTLCL